MRGEKSRVKWCPLSALIPGMPHICVHGIWVLMWILGFSVQFPPVLPSCGVPQGNPRETILEVHLCVDPASSFPLHPGWAQGCVRISGFKLGKCSSNSLFPVRFFLGRLFVAKGDLGQGLPGECMWFMGRCWLPKLLLESPSLLPEEEEEGEVFQEACLEFQWRFVPLFWVPSHHHPHPHPHSSILILSLPVPAESLSWLSWEQLCFSWFLSGFQVEFLP